MAKKPPGGDTSGNSDYGNSYVDPAQGATPDQIEARNQAIAQGNAAGQNATAANPPTGDPRGPPPPGYGSWEEYYAYIKGLGSMAGGNGSAAGDLAEKKREFDLTYQRDVARQNATEVDSLQKMLAGLSGPKDTYADLFFSHGLLPPRGYTPAPVPLTQAQKDAYGGMGVSPDQLQQQITGTGQPGANTGMLGSLGQSLQPQPGMPRFQQVNPQDIKQTGPSNPTEQGGALYGKNPAGAGAAPQVPSMAGGGQVPGQVGDPRLVVAHGGEEVNNNTDQGQLAPMNNGGVHPAIQKLMDALSGLLADPDFQQYSGVAGKAATTSQAAPKGKAPQPPGPQVTPGGIQAMAQGGTVTSPTQPDSATLSSSPGGALSRGDNSSGVASSSSLPQFENSSRPWFSRDAGAGGSSASLPPSRGTNPSPPPPPPTTTPSLGVPKPGGQGVISNTGSSINDNPIMPLDKMDPYTRALYDIHGRLRPYSAQQGMQMGPQGIDAVNSYVGRVQGGDVKAYTDLVNRLKPLGVAPQNSEVGSEGFQTA